MKSTYFRSLIGSAFFIGAIVFLGVSMNWWSFSSDFAGAWTFFITIPAILWILIFGTNIINSLFFFTGFGLLIYELGWIDNNQVITFIITLALMSVGLTILGSIGRKTVEQELFKKKTKQNDTSNINLKSNLINASFSNVSEDVKGGSIVSNFCNTAYDLTDSKILQDIELSLFANYGKIVLVVPPECKIIINSNASFGQVINKISNNSQKDGKTILIKAKIKLGEITILDKKTQ